MLSNEQFIAAEKELNEFLDCHYGKTISGASDMQLSLALANVAKKYLYQREKGCALYVNRVFAWQNIKEQSLEPRP